MNKSTPSCPNEKAYRTNAQPHFCDLSSNPNTGTIPVNISSMDTGITKSWGLDGKKVDVERPDQAKKKRRKCQIS